MLKTAHLAEAFGMKYEVHHSGNSLNNLANLHLCMAIRNTTMWEVLLPDGAHKYGMAKELEIDAGGLMHAPTAPGLGGEIDFELIARKTESVLK
jgi:L-alanine-DL-glutamate epimerase-like enolase superfamily enzyme